MKFLRIINENRQEVFLNEEDIAAIAPETQGDAKSRIVLKNGELFLSLTSPDVIIMAMESYGREVVWYRA